MKLRVYGPPGAYSAALRAQLLASKRELIDALRDEETRAVETYQREERKWASEYLRCMALAKGYGEELARAASQIVARSPTGAPFRIERDVITISMGEGRDVRVHREPRPSAACEGEER